jgi:FtsP/CotA-like multicopper oxidase with cupredoxin domain
MKLVHFALLVVGGVVAAVREVAAASEAPNVYLQCGSTGEPYKWLLVLNDIGLYEGRAGDLNNDYFCSPFSSKYPDSCEWPSIRVTKTHAKIYTSGDENDWSASTPLQLEPDNYMVTCMKEGFRLEGEYFTVPADSAEDMTVVVDPVPLPTPLGTIRLFVFNDNHWTNGQYDGPSEVGIADFGIGINDIEGPVTEDYYGNSLTDLVTDQDGMLVVHNMPPGRYDIDVGPPPFTNWIKTNTLEGGHGWDTWVYEDWDGYDQEFMKGGEPFPMLIGGYVQFYDSREDPGSRQTPPPIDNDPTPTVVGDIETSWMTWMQYQQEADRGRAPPTGTISGKVDLISLWHPIGDAVPPQVDTMAAQGLITDEQLLESGVRVKPDGGPTHNPFVIAISDLRTGQNDRANYVGFASSDGSFSIDGVPPGQYMVAAWDVMQLSLLKWISVTVPAVPIGDPAPPAVNTRILLQGWYGTITGFVFLDENENGIRDEGEPGLANGPDLHFMYGDGSKWDRGLTHVVPDDAPGMEGWYLQDKAYPFAHFQAISYFHPKYVPTGYTYTIENMKEAVTSTDVSGYNIAYLPIIGQTMTLDLGFRRLSKDRDNGSIYGFVAYDVTRVNLDPATAVTENHEAGIPGVEVRLVKPIVCPGDGEPGAGKICKDFYVGQESYFDGYVPKEMKLVVDSESGELEVIPIARTTTQEFELPSGCVMRNAKGDPVPFATSPDDDPSKVQFLQPEGARCIEGPTVGTQMAGSTKVDGRFYFDGLEEDGIYAVQVVVPKNQDKDLYKVRSETSVNAYEGYSWTGVDPSTGEPVEGCVRKPLDYDNICENNDSTPTNVYAQQVRHPCAGPPLTVGDGDFGSFDRNGGSPFKGQQRYSCDTKLVFVEKGTTEAINFHLYTEVPMPSKWAGLVIDDFNMDTDPYKVLFGSNKGLPNMPVGAFDFQGRRIGKINTDPNGLFEFWAVPSIANANMPTGSSIHGMVSCITANDPGPVDDPNPNYTTEYRSTTACFEALPAKRIVVDLAPVRSAVGVVYEPGALTPPPCDLPLDAPELYYIDKEPVCRANSDGAFDDCNWTLTGKALGTTPGTVKLVSASSKSSPPRDITMTIVSWGEGDVKVSLPPPPFRKFHASGVYQVELTTADGKVWLPGITLHLVSGGTCNANKYCPKIVHVARHTWWTSESTSGSTSGVSPTTEDTYPSIQHAIDAAKLLTSKHQLVIVHPLRPWDDPTLNIDAFSNLDRTLAKLEADAQCYFENVIMDFPVFLQGFGRGLPQTANIAREPYGTCVDGSYYMSAAHLACPIGSGATCDASNVAGYVNALLDAEDRVNSPVKVAMGAVLYVLFSREVWSRSWTDFNKPGLDGFLVQGGLQLGRVVASSALNGRAVPPVQGGAVTMHINVRYFRMTNNGVGGNSGTYAGAVRVGTPFLEYSPTSTERACEVCKDGVGGSRSCSGSCNTDLVVAHNQFVGNGGMNMAGAIGLFTGSDNYRLEDNLICGSLSQEYGGAISHVGKSSNGLIDHNILVWNRAVDEGGCLIIASEESALGLVAAVAGTPTNAADISSGSVTVNGNIMQMCWSDDDGGAFKLLIPGKDQYVITNNIMTNNVATHEGGAFSIAGATNVQFVGNTLANNLCTGTSIDSTGNAAMPAGVAVNDVTDFPKDFYCNLFDDNRAAAPNSPLGGLGLVAGDAVSSYDMNAPQDQVTSLNTNSLFKSACETCINSGFREPTFANPVKWGENEPLTLTMAGGRGLGLGASLNGYIQILNADILNGCMAGNYHLLQTQDKTNSAFGRCTWPKNDVTALDIDGDTRKTSSGGGTTIVQIFGNNVNKADVGADEDGQTPVEVIDNIARRLRSTIKQDGAGGALLDSVFFMASAGLAAAGLAVAAGVRLPHNLRGPRVGIALVFAVMCALPGVLAATLQSELPWEGELPAIKRTPYQNFPDCLKDGPKAGTAHEANCQRWTEIDAQFYGNRIMVDSQPKFRNQLPDTRVDVQVLDLTKYCDAEPTYTISRPNPGGPNSISSTYRKKYDGPPKMYMRRGHHDFGLYSSPDYFTGGSVCRPTRRRKCPPPTVEKLDPALIYGYSLWEEGVDNDDLVDYPGPTVLVKEGCTVEIELVSKLGLRSELDIDRSLHCGLVSPESSLMVPTLEEGSDCANFMTDTATPKGFKYNYPEWWYEEGNTWLVPPGEDDAYWCRCRTKSRAEVRSVLHLHGGHTHWKWDGYSESWFIDSEIGDDVGPYYYGNTYKFRNDQAPTLLFGHDHAHGTTRQNVYMGLTFLYEILPADPDGCKKINCDYDVDGEDSSCELGDDTDPQCVNRRKLPKDEYYQALMITDKVFGFDEVEERTKLEFPYSITDGEGMLMPAFASLAESIGDMLVVNGKVMPFLDVKKTTYAFNVLNMCDSRFVNLYLEVERGGEVLPGTLSYDVVSSDQGMSYEVARDVTGILLAPAQRYLIIVNFEGLRTGDRVVLRNSAHTVMGPVTEGADSDVMAFKVTADSDFPPSWDPEEDFQKTTDWAEELIDMARNPDSVRAPHTELMRRGVILTERTDVQHVYGGARPHPEMGTRVYHNGLLWGDRTTEIVRENVPEIWEFINLSPDPHSMHVHQVRFRCLFRQDLGFSYSSLQTQSGYFREYSKNVRECESHEQGPKDVITVPAGGRTVVAMVFDIPGMYIQHCHILAHEDNSMMRSVFVCPEAYYKRRDKDLAALGLGSDEVLQDCLDDYAGQPQNPTTVIGDGGTGSIELYAYVGEQVNRKLYASEGTPLNSNTSTRWGPLGAGAVLVTEGLPFTFVVEGDFGTEGPVSFSGVHSRTETAAPFSINGGDSTGNLESADSVVPYGTVTVTASTPSGERTWTVKVLPPSMRRAPSHTPNPGPPATPSTDNCWRNDVIPVAAQLTSVTTGGDTVLASLPSGYMNCNNPTVHVNGELASEVVRNLFYASGDQIMQRVIQENVSEAIYDEICGDAGGVSGSVQLQFQQCQSIPGKENINFPSGCIAFEAYCPQVKKNEKTFTEVEIEPGKKKQFLKKPKSKKSTKKKGKDA